MHILGAAIGSIAALTLYQVPVCDGSLFLGAIPESILDRRTAKVAPIANSDAV